MHEIRNINNTELLQWIRLYRCEGVGPKTFFDLLKIYGDVAKALEALPDIIRRTKKDNRKIYNIADANKELEAVNDSGGRMIAFIEPDYPELLRAIPDPPPVISVLGNVSILQNTLVAVVGSRKASINSCKFAKTLSKDLCRAGYTITSGMAIGIDSVAHCSAMEVDGDTIAVLGSGINVIYPKRNDELYHQIKEQGVILSELPWNSTPKPQSFCSRNRIISGLSLGTVVVEAGLHSGSLLTAKRALEQRRSVFAVPGFPMDSRFGGSNQLIKQDAFLIESAQDVIDVIDNYKCNDIDLFDSGSYKWSLQNNYFDKLPEQEIERIKKDIIGILDNSPVSVDHIAESTGLSIRDVLIAIVELELAGKLERHFGNKVSLIYD